jgi:hypothetical protein
MPRTSDVVEVGGAAIPGIVAAMAQGIVVVELVDQVGQGLTL